MALDANSLCPGGTGKKIKFCCKDLASDLEAIDRMLEGEQFRACLEQVERLDKKKPGRACLLAYKGILLRQKDDLAGAKANAEEFLRLYPGNQIALAEKAMADAAESGGRAAMSTLLQALEQVTEVLEEQTFAAIFAVSQVMALDMDFIAAMALLMLASQIEPNEPTFARLLRRLAAAPVAPLFVKDLVRLRFCTADVPYKEQFNKAAADAVGFHWLAAAAEFEKLAAMPGMTPLATRNLASVKGRCGDVEGCIQWLRRYAAMDIPLEDAAEAEAAAAHLAGDALGDAIDVLALEYEVTDPDQLQILLASSPDCATMSEQEIARALQLQEGEPPPKSAFLLFSGPRPEPGIEFSTETLPRIVCRMVLFGRQTDRPARLSVLPVFAPDLDWVKERIGQLGGAALGGIAKEEKVHSTSRLGMLLRRAWRLPEGTQGEQARQWTEQYTADVFKKQAIRQPLGLLNGKTIEEASADWRLRPKAYAAVLLVEFAARDLSVAFDFDAWKRDLGFPTDPISAQAYVEMGDPVSRLHRVVPDQFEDQDLTDLLDGAVQFAVYKALPRLAAEVVRRPSLADDSAFGLAMSVLANTVEDHEEALRYVEQGRKWALDRGVSCGMWDLLEMRQRLLLGDLPRIRRLVEHAAAQHSHEPEVIQQVLEFVTALNAMQQQHQAAQAAAQAPEQEPGIVIPGEQQAGSGGGLWTPDGAAPAGEKPKLWTPGS